MKRAPTNALAFVLVLLVSPGAAYADDFEPIEDEDAFRDEIVGKRLVYERGGTVIFLEDGTFGGDFSGSPVTGEWRWDEKRVCHQLSIGAKRYDYDCRMPEIDRRKVRFIQEDGHSFGIARIH